MRPTTLLRSLPPSPSYSKSLSYASTLLRTTDSDSFYPSFFYPPHVRPAYLALKALNVELARLDDEVSNAMVGKIRYQWWRDMVRSALEGKPAAHPLAHLISSLPQTSRLSSYHFTRLINARESHFLSPSFNSLQDLAEYSAGTQASLLYLLLQASDPPLPASTLSKRGIILPHSLPFEHVGNEHMGEETEGRTKGNKSVDSLTLDHAASHLAVAMTISILLRSIPHHAAKRINVIPTEIAARHGLREEDLFRKGPEAEGLRESVATLVGIAEAELRTSRACFDGTTGIPSSALPVFLSATPARSFLARLSDDRVEFNVFDGAIHKRYWKLPFQVWGDYRRGTY